MPCVEPSFSKISQPGLKSVGVISVTKHLGLSICSLIIKLHNYSILEIGSFGVHVHLPIYVI